MNSRLACCMARYVSRQVAASIPLTCNRSRIAPCNACRLSPALALRRDNPRPASAPDRRCDSAGAFHRRRTTPEPPATACRRRGRHRERSFVPRQEWLVGRRKRHRRRSRRVASAPDSASRNIATPPRQDARAPPRAPRVLALDSLDERCRRVRARIVAQIREVPA